MNVRRLVSDDAEALRAIRLEALHLHPTAFSADPDVETAFPLERWRQHLETRVWFGGWSDGTLAGINAFSVDDYSKKTAHNGHLGAMYVRKACRGSGLADALVRTLLDHAAGRGIENVLLTVEAENVSAIRLYERHGFRTIGRLARSIKVDGVCYDELEMCRQV